MRRAALILVWLVASASPAAAQPAPRVIAHRGLSAGLPENTLAAFRDALARGVAAIEVDIRPTRDGALIILHDETLDRTTNCHGPAADLDLARIRRCDAGWPLRPGEPVPTLGEALDLVAATDRRLLLDIKPGTPLPKVIDEVRRHRAETRVIFGLRRAGDVALVRRALPGTTTLGFMPLATDGPAFARVGVHAIRLWSDWIKADPAQVVRTKSLGPQAWVMVGRKLPGSTRGWRSLHAALVAAAPDAIITDRPELVP